MTRRIRESRGWTKALAGVAVGLLAGGAVVYAQAGDGVIHSCVDRTSGGTRIVSAPGLASTAPGCAATNVNEVAVDWNQAGPAGPQGSAGADGAQGPAGPQGAPGAAGTNGSSTGGGTSAKLRTVRRTITNDAFIKQAAAHCASGEHVVAGGFSLPGNFPGINVKDNRPSGTAAWYVRAFRAKGKGKWTLGLYAVCSK